MKQKVDDFFKKFNLFDYIYLPLSLLAVTIVSIVFQCDALSIVYSIIALIAVFILSKGFVIAPYAMICGYVIYAVQAYLNGLYGEAILNMFVLVPLQIFTIVSWIKNHKKLKEERSSSVIVNDIKWKEWLIIFAVAVAVGVAAYFGLRALNTNYLVLSVFTFVIPIIANYLMLRGSFYNFAVYIINSVLLVVMWLLPLFEGKDFGTDFIPMAVCFLSFAISDVYGMVNWLKLKRQQKLTQNNKNLEENTIQKEK